MAEQRSLGGDEMAPETLWNCVRQCFENDDGSLPTIELRDLTARQVADVYSKIRRRSRVVSTDATFWDVEAARDRALDDVVDAASFVCLGRAAPFHFVFGGVVERGCTLPDLGVHVFQDCIALDYRMGPAWRPNEVFALFSWLEDLLTGIEGTLVVDARDGPPDPEAFTLAWKVFRDRDAGSLAGINGAG